MEFTMEQYRESAGFLRERLGDFAPKIAMVLVRPSRLVLIPMEAKNSGENSI